MEVTHGYFLRSRGRAPAEPDVATAPVTLSEDFQDILLRAGLDTHGGVLSSRPAWKKVKATEAEVIMLYSDCDPFGSSDLTELPDSDSPTRLSPTQKRKQRW